jgi:hypothetical protein
MSLPKGNTLLNATWVNITYENNLYGPTKII